MQRQQTARTRGPLTTPQAFRRPTGAHALLVWLLLADLCGVLLWLGVGAFLTPLFWWLLQDLAPLLHSSLLLDVGSVLILACVAFGLLWQRVQYQRTDEAWGWVSVLIIGIVTVLLLVSLFKFSWLTIPASFPAIPPQPIHGWPRQLSIIGGGIAAGFSVLAHLVLFRRDRRETAERLLSLSRAHPEGHLCSLLEQAYDFYRRGLARFAQPPLHQLKTPVTFFHFPLPPQGGPETHQAPVNPERDLYWVGGELVICQAYLSPHKEQVEILWPLVARLLHDYNSPVALVERLFHIAHLAEVSPWRVWLWLPLLVAFLYERHWQAMERDRVLDRDRFAWQCGEGGRLRKLLRQQFADLQKMNQPDHTIPTLAERIDHLDSLLIIEARQLKALRATLPAAPATSPPAAP
jgi:hypothetical protein